MRKIISVLVIIAASSLFGQSQAVIITVDGLSLNNIMTELADKYGLKDLTETAENENEKEEIKQMCSKSELDIWENYLGKAAEGFALGDKVEIVPFAWNRDQSESDANADYLRDFIDREIYIAKYSGGPQKKVIVIAHSWGTVLAYAAISRTKYKIDDIDLLITLGSPLGSKYVPIKILDSTGPFSKYRNFLRNFVDGFIEDKLNLLFPEKDYCEKSVKKWINFWNYGDLFSGPIKKRYGYVVDYEFGKNQSWYREMLSTIKWHGYNSLQSETKIGKYSQINHNEDLNKEVSKIIEKELEDGSIAADEANGEGINLGFILDSSGSMTENDPHDSRKAAMKIIIDQLIGREKVFIIDFDDRVSWINSDNFENFNREQLKNAIDNINSSGGTNIGGGLEMMKQIMESTAMTRQNTGVLLLSDGLGDYNGQAEWFRQKGIPVFTISFIGEDNSKLLSSIAGLTNGKYLKVNNEIEIVAAFNQFLNSMSGDNMVAYFVSRIRQAEKINKKFMVEVQAKSVSINLMWQGSKVGLTLRSKDGTVYTSGSPNVNWVSGRNYTYVNIDRPAAGSWTAELTGDEIPPQGEDLMFSVNSNSKLKVDLNGAVASNGLVNFSLNLPSSGEGTISSSLKVTTPSKKTETISNPIVNNYFSYIPSEGAGNYNFDFSINGKNFQRFFKKTVLYGAEDGSFQPSVLEKSGNYLTISLGTNAGVFTGMSVVIKSAADKSELAEGVIVNAQADKSIIELRRMLGSQVSLGDTAEPDQVQWRRDN